MNCRSNRTVRGLARAVLLLVPLSAVTALADEQTPSAEESIPAGTFDDRAPLNQSTVLERTLDQIERLADTERRVEALRAWQEQLDGIAGVGRLARQTRLRSFAFEPDWLVRTFDEGAYARYGSIRREIQGLIQQRPVDDQRLYDLETRGLAEDLWEDFERTRNPDHLEAIVNRYLNGSFGARAAIQLADLHMDAGEPGRAIDLLDRVRSLESAEADRLAIALRAVIGRSRIGEVAEARSRWQRLGEGRRLSVEMRRRVERELIGAGRGSARVVPRAWDGTCGTSEGTRLGPSVPERMLAEQLTDRWATALDANPSDVAPAGLTVGLPGESTRPPIQDGRRAVRAWETLARPPVGGAVVADGRLLFHGRERVVCADPATGRILWMGRRHEHEVDFASKRFVTSRTGFGLLKRAPTGDDFSRFLDRVPSGLVVSEGQVFVLEGRTLEVTADQATPPTSANMTRRLRSNRLSCYELATGRQLWSRPAYDGEGHRADIGFLAVPTPAGDALIAPVSDGGEVWVHAMSRDGATLWRTYLCDEPPGGCSPWSPVRVVVSSSRAYVLPGTGAVFCINVADGSPEWAVRYGRSSQMDIAPADRQGMRYAPYDFIGWHEDAMFVHGRRLVLLPSDLDRIVCLDRNDGRLLWETPGSPVDAPDVHEFLGTHGDGLIVAGSNVVRRYELETGRPVWETVHEESIARGVVTPDGVYLPVGEKLLVVDPRDGEVLRTLAYVSPSRAPLGNLHATAAGLISVGTTRVAHLGPLATELERLAGRIDRGDATALLDRARLLDRLDRDDESVADVHRAAVESARNADVSLARGVLVVIGDLGLSRIRPRETLKVVVDDDGLARFLGGTGDPAFGDRWSEIVSDCLATIGREQLGGALESILEAAELADESHLLLAATTAGTLTAVPDDLVFLRETIEDRTAPVQRRVAIRVLESERFDDVLGDLEELLEDDDDRARLAAATALVNRSQATGVDALVLLLESENEEIRKESVTLLQAVSGRRFGFAPSGAEASRSAAIGRWQEWLAALPRGEFHVEAPVGRAVLLRGRTLVAKSTGHLVEYDRYGRERWRAAVHSPRGCFGTRDGRRLAVSYTAQTLSVFAAGDDELDRGESDGIEPVRKPISLPGRPYSVEELPNGNVLVALWSTGIVRELDTDGKTVWEASLKGIVSDARRLDNGNTLVTWYSENAVVELDREGKIVPGTRLDDMNNPRSAQRLDNGNTLVTQYRRARVVEVDPKGGIVWSRENLSGAQSAQRLPNGNTLIAHRAGVTEVRRDGSVVWEVPGGAPTHVHRY